MNPAYSAEIVAFSSLVIGAIFGWILRGLRPCDRPHGPFVRVPEGGIGHIKLEGNCELGAGFAEVGRGGQLALEITDSTRLLPGDHKLENITIQGKEGGVMFDFEAFEEVAHHALTLVQAMHAGVSTYYCEHCGAIVMVGGSDSGLLVFHTPPGSDSTVEECRMQHDEVGDAYRLKDRPTLKAKIEALRQADYG